MGRTAILVAAAIVAIGVVLVMVLKPAPSYPVARITAPDGIALTFLQDQVKSTEDCQTANRRVTQAMLASCHDCTLAESRCSADAPQELSAASGGTQDLVTATNLHILISAPPATAHTLCRTVASGIAASDKTAQCVPAAN
jgi:hypothetical protein